MLCLSPYNRIGWDFDDTLIDHPHSEKFWEFIRTNPYGQEHHIVTFRSAGWEKQVFNDLMLRGSPLRDHHFATVHAIPHDLWGDFQTVKLIGSMDEIRDDPYMVWKGATCSRNGIDILIDDATHNVIYGCEKHRVDYMHPDDAIVGDIRIFR